MRRLLLVWLLAVPACQCLEPVAECHSAHCFPQADGGADAGAPDAGGLDAGNGVDAGALVECALWDGGGVGECAAVTGYVFQGTVCHGECVSMPIVTPGIYPSLPQCLECGCDRAKFTSVPPGGVFGPQLFCDQVLVFLSATWLLDEAFPGIDAGCQPLGATGFQCTVWQGLLGDAGFARACASTLLPGVTEVQCRVFIH